MLRAHAGARRRLSSAPLQASGRCTTTTATPSVGWTRRTLPRGPRRRPRTCAPEPVGRHACVRRVRDDSSICADCKRVIDHRTAWASINLGAFVCIQCSGIHRAIGVHLSKVRAVAADDWNDDWVDNMERWGNARAGAFWEAAAPATQRSRMRAATATGARAGSSSAEAPPQGLARATQGSSRRTQRVERWATPHLQSLRSTRRPRPGYSPSVAAPRLLCLWESRCRARPSAQALFPAWRRSP